MKNSGTWIDWQYLLKAAELLMKVSSTSHWVFSFDLHLSLWITLAISVASALVSSRLDYANSVLFGCPQKHVARLQRVQQALARVVMQQSSVSPLTSTELLKQL